MSRTSRLLTRLVVVGAGSAVMASGVVPIALGVANAAAPTSIAISPTSDTETVGNCNLFTVTTQANANFDVQISQTSAANPATTTIDFCNPAGFDSIPAGSTAATPTATYFDCGNGVTGASAGQTATARCDGDFVADGNGKATFGVISDTPGTMNVVAYNDVNANNIYEAGIDNPSASATKTWVANSASSISCQPTSGTNQTGDSHFWTCSATTGSNTGVDATSLTLHWIVTQGPDTGQQGTCNPDLNGTGTGSNTGHFGNYTCGPLTNGGTAGTDTILVWADNNNNNVFDGGDASTTITKTFVAAAPAASTVTVKCSPNEDTETTGSYDDTCILPLSQHNSTITATVKNSSGAAVSGALVDFNIPGCGGSWSCNDGDESLSVDSCQTDASGTCSTTLTDPSPFDRESIEVTASVPLSGGGSATGEANIVYKESRVYEARFVTVAPASANQPSGGAQTFVATVTDRYGNPVEGRCVGWTLSGPGRVDNADPSNCGSFPTGTEDNWSLANYNYDSTCYTNQQGQCRITVITQTTENGTTTVTADIATNESNGNGQAYREYNDNTGADRIAQECSLGADTTYGSETQPGGGGIFIGTSTDQNPPTTNNETQTGLAAGTCTDAGQVTWGSVTPGKTVMRLSLTCTSHHPHKIKCVAQTTPATAGLTVALYNAKSGKKIGTDVTNDHGKAVFKLTHKKSGKTYKFQAHLRHTSTTTSADSNVSKVTCK